MFRMLGLICVNVKNDETIALISSSNKTHSHTHKYAVQYAHADSPDMRRTISPDSFFMRLILECGEVERERERKSKMDSQERKKRGNKGTQGEER